MSWLFHAHFFGTVRPCFNFSHLLIFLSQLVPAYLNCPIFEFGPNIICGHFWIRTNYNMPGNAIVNGKSILKCKKFVIFILYLFNLFSSIWPALRSPQRAHWSQCSACILLVFGFIKHCHCTDVLLQKYFCFSLMVTIITFVHDSSMLRFYVFKKVILGCKRIITLITSVS